MLATPDVCGSRVFTQHGWKPDIGRPVHHRRLRAHARRSEQSLHLLTLDIHRQLHDGDVRLYLVTHPFDALRAANGGIENVIASLTLITPELLTSLQALMREKDAHTPEIM